MTRRATYFTQLRMCSQRAWMANTRYGYIFEKKNELLGNLTKNASLYVNIIKMLSTRFPRSRWTHAAGVFGSLSS